MDATARDLTLLAAVSLLCAMVTWAGDRDILGSAFFALGAAAIGGQLCRTGADMDEEKKDTIVVVALVSLGVILMLVLLAPAVGPLMMR